MRILDASARLHGHYQAKQTGIGLKRNQRFREEMKLVTGKPEINEKSRKITKKLAPLQERLPEIQARAELKRD